MPDRSCYTSVTRRFTSRPRSFAVCLLLPSGDYHYVAQVSCWTRSTTTTSWCSARASPSRTPLATSVLSSTVSCRWQPTSRPSVAPVTTSFASSDQYYHYYYRMKRFRWRNVKRLQGHLTNAKNSDKTRVRRKVRTENGR